MNLFTKPISWIRGKCTPQRVLILLIIMVILVILAIMTWPDKELHVHFFNVGQGDSIFIRTPDNYKILIDGGPDQTVIQNLSTVLPFYDRYLDVVILTHPHADHMVGITEVLAKYQVGQVIYNLVPYESSEYQKFQNAVRDLGLTHQSFTQGQQMVLGDGVILTCFWPMKQETLGEWKDINQASIVIRLDYGEFSVLLTGDAEFGEIHQLNNMNWAPVQVLKIPHQGSKEAVTKEILDKLTPQLAIVSVGKNEFGHPDSQEINKLEEQGSTILRTDHHGTIEIVTNGKRWYYLTEQWPRSH